MISPMRQGDTLPAWAITINGDDGNPVNITGGSFTLLIRNVETRQEQTGAGTFTITNAPAGQVTYAWAAADTAEPGSYLLLVKLTFGGGGQLSTDPVPWTVQPL